ncbi:22989_t:CDS:1, partial [Gigaspora rosea]
WKRIVLESSKIALITAACKADGKIWWRSVNIWGCMGVYGVGNDYRIEGTMNKELHVKYILQVEPKLFRFSEIISIGEIFRILEID